MIDPESIPLFTGDLGQLEQHIDALRVEADGIRKAGGEAHRQFQGLSAFYEAPEAEQLFASTAPVRDAADAYADKVSGVVSALSAYAVEVGPIAKRLEALQKKAYGFVAGLKTEGGEIDENWTEDEDKRTEHNELLHEVNVARAQFYAAEIACHNKITALVGGTQYVLNTGAKQFRPLGAELYGASAEVLDQAEELPWGTPVTQDRDWWDPDDLGYYAKSYVWDGVVVDGIEGTLDGIATLIGLNGSDAAAQSWEGLVRVVVGAETYLMEGASGQKPTGIFASEFAQGSKVYAKEFAKGFVAWDQWKENPARAAGLVTFNLLTLGAGPLKAVSAGKAGTAAKVANTVGKVGEVIDPIGAMAKATGYAPKLADLTASLRNTNVIPELAGARSVLELSDGSKLVIEDGRFIAYDRHGEVVGEAPRQEPSLAEGTVPARESEPAGVGAAMHEASGWAGMSHGSGSEVPGPGGAGRVSHGHGSGGSGGAAARSTDAEPSGSGGEALGNGHVAAGSDGLSRTGGALPRHGTDAAPEANGEAVGQSADPERPSFMHDGPNPYGPPGSLTPEQIKDIQVYRANHEPGYFERYYYDDGRRRRTIITDESRFPPIQLHVDRVTGVKTAASDAPPPIPEKYIAGGEIVRGRSQVLNEETLRGLDKAAALRRSLIDYSEAARRYRDGLNDLADEFELLDASNEYSVAMNERTKAAEAYGEAIAEHQVIPELYPNSTKETLHGPANGNFRFDQVWRRKDGGFVVVEAKSTTVTTLGKRDLLSTGGEGVLPRSGGTRRAMQGSREYFIDTIQRMRMRGRKIPSESKLANELMRALKQGKVDYILVKGKVDGSRYDGYEVHKFDIG
ncbi:hypothetical protein QNN03_20920 [Streptomyces sp. GXMU-J15]|uniref:Uncharacterized protein n=1 Tax=Streptomyces fuscus TaxID=3048495 RepID=A0ABT7J218_9ACTN|nr:hypothetical protein [Streptomyces fuscus]MDL2078901.1 hypothetical protein [Streptomyces fuscus]